MARGRLPRVLMVDDEALNIDVLAAHFEGEFEVSAALDADSALEMLTRDPLPDAILLDVNMPGMDGYELCQRIKADPRTAPVPVLFVTALEQDEGLCFEVGAEDYIPKPLVPEVVRGRLRTQFRLRAALERVRRLERAVRSAEAQRDQLEKRQERLVSIVRQSADRGDGAAQADRRGGVRRAAAREAGGRVLTGAPGRIPHAPPHGRPGRMPVRSGPSQLTMSTAPPSMRTF